MRVLIRVYEDLKIVDRFISSMTVTNSYLSIGIFMQLLVSSIICHIINKVLSPILLYNRKI